MLHYNLSFSIILYHIILIQKTKKSDARPIDEIQTTTKKKNENESIFRSTLHRLESLRTRNVNKRKNTLRNIQENTEKQFPQNPAILASEYQIHIDHENSKRISAKKILIFH